MTDGTMKRNRLRLLGRRPRQVEPPACWDGPVGAPKVLIEEYDSALREAMTKALEGAGYQTASCSGPGHHGEGSCPLVDGSGCPAVDDADVILQVLAPHDLAMEDVRKAIQDHEPDLSIAVMAPRAMAAQHPDLVEGTQIWTGPLSSEGVATAVDQALTASHAPGTR